MCNNKNAYCLERARSLGIPSLILPTHQFSKLTDWDRSLAENLAKLEIDYVLLAGFMKKIGPKMLEMYKDKIINIHPSLLPKYGGKNMYGINVHRAVLENKELETGLTIHLVNEKYDEGKILAQKVVKIENVNTAEDLSEMLRPLENQFYVETLREYLASRNS